MKRLMIILFAIGMAAMSSTSVAAMSKSKIRKEARFLTDKMSYELNLSVGQRNDAYEINYDFIYSAGNIMDYVLRGEEWAMDRYYTLLDIRNDDLRWVLSDWQYRRFLDIDYFFRPIYASGNKWHFRIYVSYPNHNHFYFGRPYHYTSYHCNHYRTHHNHVSYYRGRYNHNVYVNVHSVRDNKVYHTNRRTDFGTVKMRPNTSKPRESVNPSRTSGPRTSTVRTTSGNNNNNNSGTSSRRTSGTSSTVNSSATPNRSTGTSTSSGSSVRSTNTPSRSSGTSSSTSRSSSSSSSSNKSSGSSVNSGSSSSSSRSSVSSPSSSSRSSSSSSSSVSRSSSGSSNNRSSSSSSGSSSRSSSSSSGSSRSSSRR